MSDQGKRDKVINKIKAIVADMQEEVDEWKDYSDSELRGGLTCDCDWWYKTLQTLKDALALLKTQKEATIEPKRIDLEEETKAWLDEMDAVEALWNIANICQDWDGYRTADGLGGLINEIWAYARYCADRIAKAQEAVEPSTLYNLFICPVCKNALFRGQKFCHECGRKVKWDEHTS